MIESVKSEELEFEPLTPEEKISKGILGRLIGPVASCVKATRNGRKYSDVLWEKAFDSPIVKEMFANGGLPGELNHPADRSETDATKIAIMMPQPPKKDKNGHLVACLDILDTPCGRIAYQLAKYGFKFGISSRGEGDVTEGWDGEEVVDPQSYSLEAFDLVLLPAVETARLRFTESFDTHKKTLKTALLEAVQNSSEDEQRVMKSTLEELNIDYSTEEDNTSDSVDYNIDVTSNDIEAENTGSNIISELQESLQRQQELESTIKLLQEKLSVCYTKESRYSDKLSKANSKLNTQEIEKNQMSMQIQQLTEEKTQLEQANKKLNEEVCAINKLSKEKDSKILTLTEDVNSYRAKFAKANDKLKAQNSSTVKLNENLTANKSEVKKLTEEYNRLKESCKKDVEKANKKAEEETNKNKKLVEEIQDLKKDALIVKGQHNAKIEKAQQLVEKYKSIAKTAVDKYITSQAVKAGVSASEIKSRLNESYSFNDIDKAVEDAQQYKLAMKSLPFNTLSDKKPIKMTIKESKDPLLESLDNSSRFDDDVDETLLTFTV